MISEAASRLEARVRFIRMVMMVCALEMLVGPGRVMAQRPLGVDVSDFQGSGINWASVKASGVSFAWTKATEGTFSTASTFTVNEANAQAAGVLIGAYDYARPDLDIGTAGADAEAARFWNVTQNYIKGGGMYLVPMLDIEQAPGGSYTKASLSAWVNEWCQDIVNDAAAVNLTVHPGVCTYSTYANTWLDSTVTQWPLWMTGGNGQSPQTGAPTGTSPWATWDFWQYSYTNSVPGISGSCDADVFNGTPTSLEVYVIPEPGTAFLLTVPALLCVLQRLRK
jgi:GH25 family lysozyme M1 (1,4-beta-N-acetylmuramidase)